MSGSFLANVYVSLNTPRPPALLQILTISRSFSDARTIAITITIIVTITITFYIYIHTLLCSVPCTFLCALSCRPLDVHTHFVPLPACFIIGFTKGLDFSQLIIITSSQHELSMKLHHQLSLSSPETQNVPHHHFYKHLITFTKTSSLLQKHRTYLIITFTKTSRDYAAQAWPCIYHSVSAYVACQHMS